MSAYPGDEVFFHHEGEPRSGKVLSAGQHGCMIEHGGKKLPVKWSKIAGHKKRAAQQFSIVDKGEDGVIVADKAGRKRYVSAPQKAPEEKPLKKSFDQTYQSGDAVMLKSGVPGVIVGRPGLDGAHVMDAAGSLHRARWDDLSPDVSRNG